MPEVTAITTDLQGGDLTAPLRNEINQTLPWGRQRYQQRRIAFYGICFFAVVAFLAFLGVVVGCIGHGLVAHEKTIAMIVLSIIPVLLSLALLRYLFTPEANAAKASDDYSPWLALAKEVIQIFKRSRGN
ncbi:MAG: hypothetical protein QM533_12285 [Cytophagales bacterium]|nr:hypothetical protein [Cytophagales bacterium]